MLHVKRLYAASYKVTVFCFMYKVCVLLHVKRAYFASCKESVFCFMYTDCNLLLNSTFSYIVVFDDLQITIKICMLYSMHIGKPMPAVFTV